MPFPVGPTTVTAAPFTIEYPTSPPENTAAVILSNYSQYLLRLSFGGTVQWLLPWTADVFSTTVTGSPTIKVEPQLAGATPPSGAASYLTGLFFAKGEPNQPGGAFPLALNPAAANTTTTAMTFSAARVDAAQTRAAGANVFGDLATVGPAVTLDTGTSVFVWLSAELFNPLVGTYSFIYMAVAVTGATTLNPSVGQPTLMQGPLTYVGTFGYGYRLDGLTVGTNTFTCKYARDTVTNNPTWGLRNIAVQTL